MKNDQLLDEMVDLASTDLSLSGITTRRLSEEVLACTARVTLRVMYGGGLRRTIDNNVAYELRRRDDEGHVAVRVRRFSSLF